MNEESTIEKALANELPDELLKSLLSDPTRREEFDTQARMDAALQVMLGKEIEREAQTESIMASIKTVSAERITERILATTHPATLWSTVTSYGVGVISRVSVQRLLSAAAVMIFGALLGNLVWPGVVRQYDLAEVITSRTGKPFHLPGDEEQSVASLPTAPVQEPETTPITKPAIPPQHFDDIMAAGSVPVRPTSLPSEEAKTAPQPASTTPPPAAVVEKTVAIATVPTVVATMAPVPEPAPQMMLTTHARPSDGERVDFEKHVLPILQRACFKCHSDELKKPKGGIRLDDVAAMRTKSRTDNLIFPHKPQKSTLFTSIAKPVGDSDIMPPAKEGKPLASEDIALIEKWVSQGANFGEWTSAKAKEVQITTATEAVDAANALSTARRINELVEKGLSEHNKAANPLADDATFLRRVSLDLVGRIPTTDEALKFMRDKAEDKRAKLINELLASNGHVSHMFNYWCDLLRARDSLADDVDGETYLAWIKRSVRDNEPYDQWARELLSPEGFGWKAPAAGYYLRDGDNRQTNMETTATLFLGTQIACAQCHDHPYDKWTRKDYHTFLAWTSGIEASSQDASVGDVIAGEIMSASKRYDHLAMVIKNEERSAKYNKLSDAVKTLQRAAGGSGLMNGEGKLAVLPMDYQYDDGKPGEELAPAVLFGSAPSVQQGKPTAQAFAEWVTSPENSRFTLTLANRLWTKLFGLPFAGPVDQVRDIKNCDNPDLAQYLVNVVRESKYDVRQVLRILCLTQAYQREASAPVISGDDGVYRFQGPLVRRLSAEQIWDSMMALAVPKLDESLDYEAAGKESMEAATKATKTSEVTAAARKMVAAQEREAKASERRSRKFGDMAVEFAGGTLERASELPQPTPNGHFLRMFGQGNRDFINDSWRQATVPQALLMLNSDFFDHVARSGSPLSEAMKRSTSPSDIIRAVFIAVLTREPSKTEIRTCLDTLGETRNPKALARTLLTTAEFAFQK